MFLKKKPEFNEEELKLKRLELDASLLKAEELKKNILDQRVAKLKRNTSKIKSQKSDNFESATHLKSFRNCCGFWQELCTSSTLDEFQVFMQKSETVSKASNLVSFIEIYCLKGSFESIKTRSKIFMSLALLANYPNEVIPNANPEENDLLEDSKYFYDHLGNFLKDPLSYSVLTHKEISLIWISTIQKFDEWMAKDKKVFFDKMMLDFMTWTKTIGSLSINSDSWKEWEPHAIRYQNEIIKRIHDIFGEDHVKVIEKEVNRINETFDNAELFIEFDSELNGYSCHWCEKDLQGKKIPEDNLLQSSLAGKVKSTNIKILHELMLKEKTDFESILEMSGKSLKEISDSNREGISKLILILGNQTDTASIASSMQEIFHCVVSVLRDLAGDNEDYCEEIRITDPTIDPSTWLSDSSSLLRWILSICKRCCAPVRDQNCNELEMCIQSISEAETSKNLINSFVNTFTILFDLLNLMRNDFCNFRMKFLVSQIEGKNIAESYELEEFRKKFKSATSKTEKWLNNKKNEEYKPIEILANSYIELIDPAEEEITESNVPETFYLDIERIKRFRLDLTASLVKDAGLIYDRNHARLHRGNLNEAEKLASSLKDSAQKTSEMFEIQELFEKCAQTLEKDPKGLLINNMKRLFKCPSEDKVFALLKNRELSKLKILLISAQKGQPGTLPEKICNFFNYNKACYSSIYDEIILNK